MAKYIIKLERGETAYKTVNSNGKPMIQLLAPTPYTEPDLEQVRKDYDTFYEHGYEQGLVDAWDMARKIQDTGGNLTWWIHNVSASEAIEKIRQYEQEQQIAIGDEVVFYNGEKCVVTVVGDGQVEEVMDENGFSMKMDDGLRNSMKKTGRHFDEIATVLQKMQESQ